MESKRLKVTEKLIKNYPSNRDSGKLGKGQIIDSTTQKGGFGRWDGICFLVPSRVLVGTRVHVVFFDPVDAGRDGFSCSWHSWKPWQKQCTKIGGFSKVCHKRFLPPGTKKALPRTFPFACVLSNLGGLKR